MQLFDYFDYWINDENIRLLGRKAGKRQIKKLKKDVKNGKKMDSEG